MYTSFLDIDDCATFPCHVRAVCHNFVGGFECVCKSGYTGPGAYCRGRGNILSYKPGS